jgi:peptidoglycan/xylan/chitin deacetylase (PgdA/CDA1 family)
MFGKSQAIELPSQLRLTALWRRFHRNDVPVLFLHGVLPDEASRLFNASGKFISPALLRRFLERLGQSYRFITLDDYLDHMHGRRSLGGSLLLAFDDGYANNYEYAYPLLNGMGIPFSVFVATGFVDTRDVMWTDLLEYAINTTREPVLRCILADGDIRVASTGQKAATMNLLRARLKVRRVAEAQELVREICNALEVSAEAPELDAVRFLGARQIREMHEHGVIIGSHTVNHAILARECADDVKREVVLSRDRLESIIGEPIRYFAYPNGRRADFNAGVKGALKDAGYAAALSTLPGISNPGDDLYEVRRYAVNGHLSFRELETRISGMIEFLKGNK